MHFNARTHLASARFYDSLSHNLNSSATGPTQLFLPQIARAYFMYSWVLTSSRGRGACVCLEPGCLCSCRVLLRDVYGCVRFGACVLWGGAARWLCVLWSLGASAAARCVWVRVCVCGCVCVCVCVCGCVCACVHVHACACMHARHGMAWHGMPCPAVPCRAVPCRARNAALFHFSWAASQTLGLPLGSTG